LWGGIGKKEMPSWLLKLAVYQLPLAWLACLAGWYVTEAGKQPWAVAGVLPTFTSASSLSAKELIISTSVTILTSAALVALGIHLIKNILQTFVHHSSRGDQS
jgi:cytochrome d ubiquinol oxidase subunit I